MTLTEKALEYNRMLKESLQLIFDELNPGQTQKILKNEEIKRLVDRFHITHKRGEEE